MQAVTVRRALNKYGLSAAGVDPVQKGYRNESHPAHLPDGQQVNLILYKQEPGILAVIHRTNAVSSFLAAQGFPVRQPLDPRIMRVSDAHLKRYACLYNYLSGETIPWEAYTRDHIKLLGQTMAELHTALARYGGELPRVADEYLLITRRMERYFADEPVRLALSNKLGLCVKPDVFIRLRHILSFCNNLPGQQALHMDFVRSNILFSRSTPLKITGILDFEKVACGHPLFDVARTLAFLLVDCKYKPAEKVRKYFLYSGYQKRGQRQLERVTVTSHGTRRLLLEELLDLFLFYDFYKFLRHNPYEFLNQNEHFVRTETLLINRGVITTTSISSPLEQMLLQ